MAVCALTEARPAGSPGPGGEPGPGGPVAGPAGRCAAISARELELNFSSSQAAALATAGTGSLTDWPGAGLAVVWGLSVGGAGPGGAGPVSGASVKKPWPAEAAQVPAEGGSQPERAEARPSPREHVRSPVTGTAPEAPGHDRALGRWSAESCARCTTQEAVFLLLTLTYPWQT